jgi:hypothetical protein
LSSDTFNKQPIDDAEFWKMPVSRALPLIMDKFDCTEAEAFRMWFDHQKSAPPVVDDVMDNDEFEKKFPKSGSRTFSFKTGKRIDVDDDK